MDFLRPNGTYNEIGLNDRTCLHAGFATWIVLRDPDTAELYRSVTYRLVKSRNGWFRAPDLESL